MIPFEVTIPPADQVKDLPKKLLEDEGSAIMAWAVQGALAWQRDGLSVPERIKAATQSYRDESDALGDFINGFVVERTGAYVTSADLYTAYERWCENNATEAWKKNTFGQAMKERGFQSEYKSHSNHYGRYYHGITLRAQEPDAMELGDAAEPEMVTRVECGPGHPSWPG